MKELIQTLKSLVSGGNKKDHSGARDFLLNAMPAKSVCAEIGVYRGDFSQRILEVVKPSKLHLIDPWFFQTSETYDESLYGGPRGESQAKMDAIHDSVLQRFEVQIKAAAVSVHRATSVEAAATFPDHYFDWVYIDGDHQYEFVKADLHAYFPKVKVGGYVAGDDYGEGGWWKGGVMRAVDEFVAQMNVGPVQIKGRQFWFKKN